MSNTPPLPSRINRPPRITIGNGSSNGSVPASLRSVTIAPAGTPLATPQQVPGGYWQAYDTTENFVMKGLEGFVDFTKTGMSFGEQFTFRSYRKITKWSKKWFTHIFLFLVIALYTVGGALIFTAIEG